MRYLTIDDIKSTVPIHFEWPSIPSLRSIRREIRKKTGTPLGDTQKQPLADV